jgi:hypothetical protein
MPDNDETLSRRHDTLAEADVQQTIVHKEGSHDRTDDW